MSAALPLHGSANWVRPFPGRSAIRNDTALAALFAFAMTLTSLLYQRSGLYDHPADPWIWVIGIGLSTAPLALRRRYPEAVAVIVAIGFFVIGQFRVPELLMTNICLFLALYTVGAWSRNRQAAFWVRFGITLAMLVWILVTVVVNSADPTIMPRLSRSGLFSAYATFAALQIVTNLLYFGGAFFFGERGWRSARTQALLGAQGRELELERQTSATQAVALDRIGIARELHDVVAHHVSVMGIQAAAARRSLENDPARAAAALEVVEQSAHTAVEELRRLVHTLRTPEAEDASSTIGVAQLSTLVAESQGVGVPTTLIVAGDSRPLPMLVNVALYRVVQEALTNVRKHAGRGASAEVRLRFGDRAIEVEVTDDGVRQTLASSTGSAGRSGLGLRGMRERIGAVGGTVEAGRREQGGFMVRATVPLSVALSNAALSNAVPSNASGAAA
ncbi:MAG: sensor histidine kinase [Actinobacteria bacterium]|nr:sensor histidine kinase [Actinomycetota bacterium]